MEMTEADKSKIIQYINMGNYEAAAKIIFDFTISKLRQQKLSETEINARMRGIIK